MPPVKGLKPPSSLNPLLIARNKKLRKAITAARRRQQLPRAVPSNVEPPTVILDHNNPPQSIVRVFRMVKGVPTGTYEYVPVKNTVMYPDGNVAGQAKPLIAAEHPDALPHAEPACPPALPAVPPPPEADVINDIDMENAVPAVQALPAPDPQPQPTG